MVKGPFTYDRVVGLGVYITKGFSRGFDHALFTRKKRSLMTFSPLLILISQL